MNETSKTYIVIAALIVFGIYRKKVALTDSSNTPDYLASTSTGSGPSQSSYTYGKYNLAKIAYEVQQKLGNGESIIQVHDYSNESVGSGVQHTFDVTVFNSATTQALTKRITCLKKGSELELLSQELLSPITGSIVKRNEAEDGVSLLLMEDMEVDNDATFVRDKYTFVTKHDLDLPPEPIPPREECRRQANEVPNKLTKECKLDIDIYTRSMAQYRKQVQEARANGTFTRRQLAFAPTDQTVPEHTKYPFSHPQTYGFTAHEDAPIDYSVLEMVQPMKDEHFFNTIAMEKSALGIQYN
jgi:hypothetical protein